MKACKCRGLHHSLHLRACWMHLGLLDVGLLHLGWMQSYVGLVLVENKVEQ